MIPIDEVVVFDVVTHVASTGAVSDADSAPTFDVFEEDTDTPILAAQTMTKRTSKTGNYRGSFTASAANGFEAGKWYSVVVSGTVSSVSAKCVAKHFRVAPVESQAGVPKTDVGYNAGTAITSAAGIQEVKVASIAAAAITAAAIASDAITDAKVASDVTIASVTGAVGSVTGAVGSISSGGISAASFAAGAIDAAAIAADAIGSSELAASAVTEIQAGLSTLDAAAVRSAVGLASANLDTQIAAIQADTDNLQTRIPAALVSGRIDASVGAMATDTLTAGALAASAVTEIQSGLSTIDAAGVRTAVGLASANLDTQLTAIDDYIDTEVAAIKAKTDNLPASPAATGDIPSAATIATATAAQVTTDHGAGSYIRNTEPLDAAGTRSAVGLASANLDTQIDALPTNAELATALGTADDAVLAAIAALNNLSQANIRTAIGMSSANLDTQLAALFTTAMTESYAADGAAPTPAQALFLIQQRLTEFAIVSTTTTVKKLDGSTTAVVLTHDDATSPTTSTRTA